MPIDTEDRELLDCFLAETAELLEKLDDDLIALEKASDNPELINRIFRSIHTVKGSAGFMGFDLLVRVTHKTEDVLNRLRKGELPVTSVIMDVVLEAVDLVKVLVGDIKAGDIQERYVVVIGAAEKRIGLVVNHLLGQQEVAIKSLGNYLADIPGIAGSTILGDGRVTLIVDPASMLDV